MKYLYILLILFFCTEFTIAQQIQNVDFEHINANLTVNLEEKRVEGFVSVDFTILKDTDSIYLDAVNTKVSNVILNNSLKNLLPKSFITKKHLVLRHSFKKGTQHNISFNYSVKPKKALYFVENTSSKQAWTQGQGKNTSNWLPSINNVNDKIKFNLSITTSSKYNVIANGVLKNKTTTNNTSTWIYTMKKPMSSYLVALVIGTYKSKTEISKNKTPLTYFYYPEDSLKIEPTYRHTKAMFNFLETEIGVPYPWQNYKQIPVHDFLYFGMENTGTTIFTDDYVIDNYSFEDKNYVNVNAHELAHQWFGNLVTATSSKHHWLQEGFATYYALLAERELFGNNYYYWQLFKYVEELQLQNVANQSTSLLNPKASSTTFYKRGAFVLHLLRDLIGDTNFKLAVKNYLTKHQFKAANTQDFFDEVSRLYPNDLEAFKSNWMLNETFNYEPAITHLRRKSTFIDEYLNLDCEVKTSKCKDMLSTDFKPKTRAKIIRQAPELVDASTFKTTNYEVKQALADVIPKLPKKLKENAQSLLESKSYKTLEITLFNLWITFPENRNLYLNKTKHIIGFNNKNVRMLWLALALNTQTYKPEKHQDFLNELFSYTNTNYSFYIRQEAFTYLDALGAFNKESLINLKHATTHHNWRFKKFSKELLTKLAQTKQYKSIIEQL